MFKHRTSSTYRDALNPSRKQEQRQFYTRYVLQLLGSTAMVALAAILNPTAGPKLARTFLRSEAWERKKLNRALARLEWRGLVRRQKRDDGNEYLLLTESGKKEFMHEKRRMLALRHPKKWDGLWRIVMFDITERKKRIRDAMRRHLRDLGLYRLQKSVFVTPYPCGEEVRFLKEFYECDNEVCVVTATSLGNHEKRARQFFGI